MLYVARALQYASVFSPLLPLLLFVVKGRSVKQRYVIYLILLILFSFAVDVISLIQISNSHSTAIAINVQDVLQFFLLLMIYREFYLKDARILVALVTIYGGFEIANSLFCQGINNFQTWTWALGSVMCIGMSIGHAAHMLKHLPTISVTRYAPTWISAGVVFYFSFSLHLFVMAEYVFTHASRDTSLAFWGLHNLNNLIKNILFTVAIYFGEETK